MSPLNPLQHLYRLEPSSSQFPVQVAGVLDGEEYKASVQTLQDGDLVWLVGFFDNVRLRIILTSDSTLNFGAGSWQARYYQSCISDVPM